MGKLDDFIGCTIKHDLTNMTLKISQTYLINNMILLFKEDVKSLMTFNNPDTPHQGIVRKAITMPRRISRGSYKAAITPWKKWIT